MRNRKSHTENVARISITIARALGLNEDLAEAIALGHDLGHAPFGHSGESALNELMPGGFNHAVNSVRMADLEKPKLNLTLQVKDGILNHGSDKMAQTLEGQIVKFADKIAYITHDFDDAIRLGLVPKDFHVRQFGLGETYSEMIDTMVKAVISSSISTMCKGIITMQEDVWSKMKNARKYEFDVIINNEQKRRDNNAKEIIKTLFDHYKNKGKTDQEACDYISGMTDDFAFEKYRQIITKKSLKGWSALEKQLTTPPIITHRGNPPSI